MASKIVGLERIQEGYIITVNKLNSITGFNEPHRIVIYPGENIDIKFTEVNNQLAGLGYDVISQQDIDAEKINLI